MSTIQCPRITRPTDLHAPGAIEQLLAFHRQTFGGWTMVDAPPADAPPADAPPADAPPADAPPADAPPADDSPWADPDKAKSEIERLRRENGADRTQAKQQAADEARKAVIDEVAKSLGLKDGDKAPTVDDLTKQLTEQTGKTQEVAATARDTQAELVIWKNAATLGVDAQALTDSRAFAAAIKDLDPADAKFAEDVKKAAQAAVENNPKLKSTQAAGSSSADHGGSGGDAQSKTPKSLNAAVGGHYGT